MARTNKEPFLLHAVPSRKDRRKLRGEEKGMCLQSRQAGQTLEKVTQWSSEVSLCKDSPEEEDTTFPISHTGITNKTRGDIY